MITSPAKRPRHSIRDGREHEKWLDRILELQNQGDVDEQHGNRHHDAEFLEPFLLFVIFAADLKEISGR